MATRGTFSIWRDRLVRLIVITLVFTFTVTASQAASLKLGHTVPPSHVWHKVAERFADNLKEKSNGKFDIKVHPLSRLGNEGQMVDMIQSGAIQFSILPAAMVANREESLLGWFLPYLFQNVEEAGAATQLPAAQTMLKNLEPQGIIGLGYMFAGQRHVLALNPVESVNDLKNKKIRSFPSPIFNDWWAANGAAPTALPLAEISPSLSTGLLDAVDVDLDIVVGLKFYQQARYLALTNHMAFPAVIIASKKWWDGLSPADRALIQEVYAEAETWGIGTQAKAEVTNLETLKKAGVEVTKLAMEEFGAVGEKITDKYVKSNKTIADFYSEVKASQGKK